MEKRKWPWKRKASESESSESFSSHFERFSDEQEGMKESAIDNLQLPEVTSKAIITDDEMKETVKSLTEKLSAALVNVSAKEEIVKQHAKVAEEAVAGWEKAENEVASLKQQLEVALQQNLKLEVKTSHLDSALKECVRQLRQARDEQEKRVSAALMEKNSEWESMKAELEKRILDLQAENSAPNTTTLVLEAMEKENSSLKEELVSRCKELEVVTIERDLSTRAAETASKLQLESIKKVAKLEAECRRLQSVARRLESVGIGREPGCSGSRASSSISENDEFKKTSAKNLGVEIDMMDDFLEMERLAALPESSCRESVWVDNSLRGELDSMVQRVADLENVLEKMETEKLELQNTLYETVDSLEKAESRIAEDETRLEELQEELNAVNEAKESLEFQLISLEDESTTISANVDPLKAEAEAKLEEVQKELNAVNEANKSLEFQLIAMEEESRTISANADSLKAEAEARLEEVQKELTAVNKIKESLELQLTSVEEESRTISANVDSLKAEIETERKLSAELRIKCQELENELSEMVQEMELQQNMNSNGDLKIKQEDLAVAADKLAECQKTIASLGRQLESLATLEDFLIDTSSIPGFSRDSLDSTARAEFWRLSSNETFVPNGGDSGLSRMSMDSHDGYVANGNGDSPRSSSLSPLLTNHEAPSGAGIFLGIISVEECS